MSKPQPEEIKELIEKTEAVIKRFQRAGLTEANIDQISTAAQPDAPAIEASDKQTLMQPICDKVSGCTECPLHEGRNKTVFGDGNLDAKLVFVGEGPGRDEDAQGLPFVGRAGQLLTKIIEAMGYQRKDVYICNVVKCRPPNNRQPLPEEMASCISYLEAQLSIIRPKAICALGKTAAMALLETDSPMKALRGREFVWNNIPLFVTYHPAYLLRNPHAKKDVWEDMQQVMSFLKEN